jgi:LysM repeat protein
VRIRAAAAIPAAAVVLLALPTTAAASFQHVVAAGESLSSIAATDGLTVAELAAANGLPPTAELLTGAQLAIPPQGGEVPAEAAGGEPSAELSAQPSTPTASAADGDQDGDDGATASEPVPGDDEGAATTESTQVEAAATPAPVTRSVGDGDADSDDSVGTSEGSSGISSSVATSQPVGAAAEGSPGSPPYPTAEKVSPAQVSAIAAANGVPSSLANAVADEESGFNNELVSSAAARGVMQITPGTWSWINETLAGSTPLAPASALENVRGGVLLLHALLEATGGNETLAAAGYYQGLPSVLANGMYPSTQEYVGTVQALQQRFGGG